MADTLERHKVVAHDAWLEARKQLLAREKEFTRLRDQLSQARRDLPWERVDKRYVFEGPNGQEALPELFDGRSQLIVYHFMFAPDWEEGCPLNVDYHYLDLVPKGRDEGGEGPFWVRRHDEYGG